MIDTYSLKRRLLLSAAAVLTAMTMTITPVSVFAEGEDAAADDAVVTASEVQEEEAESAAPDIQIPAPEQILALEEYHKNIGDGVSVYFTVPNALSKILAMSPEALFDAYGAKSARLHLCFDHTTDLETWIGAASDDPEEASLSIECTGGLSEHAILFNLRSQVSAALFPGFVEIKNVKDEETGESAEVAVFTADADIRYRARFILTLTMEDGNVLYLTSDYTDAFAALASDAERIAAPTTLDAPIIDNPVVVKKEDGSAVMTFDCTVPENVKYADMWLQAYTGTDIIMLVQYPADGAWKDKDIITAPNIAVSAEAMAEETEVRFVYISGSSELVLNGTPSETVSPGALYREEQERLAALTKPAETTPSVTSEEIEDPRLREGVCFICGFCPEPMGLCVILWAAIILVAIFVIVGICMIITLLRNKVVCPECGCHFRDGEFSCPRCGHVAPGSMDEEGEELPDPAKKKAKHVLAESVDDVFGVSADADAAEADAFEANVSDNAEPTEKIAEAPAKPVAPKAPAAPAKTPVKSPAPQKTAPIPAVNNPAAAKTAEIPSAVDEVKPAAQGQPANGQAPVRRPANPQGQPANGQAPVNEQVRSTNLQRPANSTQARPMPPQGQPANGQAPVRRPVNPQGQPANGQAPVRRPVNPQGQPANGQAPVRRPANPQGQPANGQAPVNEQARLNEQVRSTNLQRPANSTQARPMPPQGQPANGQAPVRRPVNPQGQPANGQAPVRRPVNPQGQPANGQAPVRRPVNEQARLNEQVRSTNLQRPANSTQARPMPPQGQPANGQAPVRRPVNPQGQPANGQAPVRRPVNEQARSEQEKPANSPAHSEQDNELIKAALNALAADNKSDS